MSKGQLVLTVAQKLQVTLGISFNEALKLAIDIVKRTS